MAGVVQRSGAASFGPGDALDEEWAELTGSRFAVALMLSGVSPGVTRSGAGAGSGPFGVSRSPPGNCSVRETPDAGQPWPGAGANPIEAS